MERDINGGLEYGSRGYTMPRLGQKMTEETIVEWYKKEGNRAEELEPLFLVDLTCATRKG